MKNAGESSATVIFRMIVGVLGLGILALAVPALIAKPSVELMSATAGLTILFFGYAFGFEQHLLRLIKSGRDPFQ